MLETKTSLEFEKLYGVLNPEQRKAVDTIDGPVMVIAGPGTGKTTILTLRIANILKQTDASPDSILALTFTESGAFAMRRKLAGIVGKLAYRVRIQTFHGFAESLIREFPDYFPRIIGSTIVSEAEQIKIIQTIIRTLSLKYLRPFGDESYYIRPILSEIHLLKRENIRPRVLSESVKNDMRIGKQKEMSKSEREKIEKRDAKNLELAKVYDLYEKELAKRKLYDFDDMLLEVIQLMETDQSFKLLLQERHQYVLADEHQDANAAQNRILELLVDFYDSPNLFIVGDEKQAIYRFQGASLENFLYFSRKYPGAVVVDLKHNYRSHQGILDAAYSLIENNPGLPDRKRTRLVSLQVGSKPIFVDEFKTLDEELHYLSTIIGRLIKSGEKPEDIAVLYRENRQAAAVAEALKVAGIPYQIESDNNILDEIEPNRIIVLCRAIGNPANDEYLGKALLLPEMSCDPALVSEAFTWSRQKGQSLYQILKASGGELAEAYEKIRHWSGRSVTIPFPDFIRGIIRETGLIKRVVTSSDSLTRLSSLQSFFERVVDNPGSKETYYLADFLENVEIMREHGLSAKKTSLEQGGRVRLMTAHRSKGLEFNHIFLVQVVDGSWGNRNHRNLFQIPIVEPVRDSGRIEDERRLFYVALTRARESVNISYALSGDGKERVASQFISEIDSRLVSFEQPVISSTADIFVGKFESVEVGNNPILDIDFVRTKFLSQPFSVTHLNNYLECPWRYFFVNLLRVPQEATKHQMYGIAVHSALKIFFEAYREERDLTKKQLLDIFGHELAKTPLSGKDRDESLEKGRRALGGYYDEYYPNWGRTLATERLSTAVLTFYPFEAKNPTKNHLAKGGRKKQDRSKSELELELTGKLDKIEYIDEKNVVVVDYKTAKPRSRNEIEGKTSSADGNYKRQLVFYKLLLDSDGRLKMRAGEIDFIEPNDRGIYKKERFEIEEKEVADLKKTIERVACEIISLSFVKSSCKDKDCEYCRLGRSIVSERKLSSDKGVQKSDN